MCAQNQRVKFGVEIFDFSRFFFGSSSDFFYRLWSSISPRLSRARCSFLVRWNKHDRHFLATIRWRSISFNLNIALEVLGGCFWFSTLAQHKRNCLNAFLVPPKQHPSTSGAIFKWKKIRYIHLQAQFFNRESWSSFSFSVSLYVSVTFHKGKSLRNHMIAEKCVWSELLPFQRLCSQFLHNSVCDTF